jgi:Sugar-transfer associated ATP-grasp
MGTTGNFIAYGDPRDGTLLGALTLHECGSGMTAVAAHPETGLPFAGFRLPYWSDAMALVATAQRVFPELATLGWDIALTEDGPIIIEANARWDPPLYAPFLMSAENWQRLFGGARPVLA